MKDMNNNPQSELDWTTNGEYILGFHDSIVTESIKNNIDAKYIVHACNAYPKLIQYVRDCVTGDVNNEDEGIKLLRELGEQGFGE